MYKTKEGFFVPTLDQYVTTYNSSGHPNIIGSFNGHSAEVSIIDMNSDGVEEILIFFNSGSNQRNIAMFTLLKDEFEVVNTDEIYSNLNEIEIITDSLGNKYLRSLFIDRYSEEAIVEKEKHFRFYEGHFEEVMDFKN